MTDPGNRRERLVYIVLLMAAFLLICWFRYVIRGINDDAMITYRYAQNLAGGLGFVYNEGERVLGTTTPLYTLMVAAAIRLGIAPWTFSLVLDCFLMSGVVALLFHWLRRTGDVLLPWVGTVLLFHSPHGFLPLAGMETGVFLALSLGALYLAWGRYPAAGIVLGFLAGLTRPEGLVTLALALFPACFDWERRRFREGWWKYAAGVLVAGLIVLLIVYMYFGSIVPQSVVAKRLQGQSGGWELFIHAFFREQFKPFGILNYWAALEWIGLGVLWWRYPITRPLVLWFVGYLVFLTLGRAPYYVWYMTPLYPIRVLATAAAVLEAGREFGKIAARAMAVEDWRHRVAVPLAGCALILGGLGHQYVSITSQVFLWGVRSNFPVLYAKKYEEAGVYIREHSQAGDEVVTPEIGYVGYLSGRRIFDPVGLVTPEAIALGEMRSMWDWAVERESEWVVMSWFQESGFQPLPGGFTLAFEPVACWQDAVFNTFVFRRGESSAVAEAAESRVGIDPAVFDAVYTIER